MNRKILLSFLMTAATFLSCKGGKDHDPNDPIQAAFFPDEGIYGVWISGSKNNAFPVAGTIPNDFIPSLLGPNNFTNNFSLNPEKKNKFDQTHFQILRIYKGTDSANRPVAKFSYCRQDSDNTSPAVTAPAVTEGSGSVFILKEMPGTVFSLNGDFDQYWNPVDSADKKSKHLLIYNAGNTNTLSDCMDPNSNCDMAIFMGMADGIGNVFYRVNSHKTKTVINSFPFNTWPYNLTSGAFEAPSGCGPNL